MTDTQIAHDKLMLSLRQQWAYSNLAKCFENKHLTLRLQWKSSWIYKFNKEKKLSLVK